MRIDEDCDGLPPAGCEQPAPSGRDPVADDVAFLLDDLDRIAAGVEVPFNVDNAICKLQSAFRRAEPFRIDHKQRDQLLGALAFARPRVLDLFAGPVEKISAAHGLDAFAGLIFHWSESDAWRAARHPHARADLNDYARLLRNECQNICLREDIRRRQGDRIAGTVTHMLREALG